MMDERGSIWPFGWMVTCTGRSPSRVRGEVEHLARDSARAWARHFPPEHGYQIELEAIGSEAVELEPVEPGAKPRPPAHEPHRPAETARMFVRRGDFWAQVSVEHALPPSTERGASPSVRMFGRAQCESLHQAHTRGERVVARARVIGWSSGVAVFLSLAWLMIGVRDPVYVLGGMLLVVALLSTVMAGGALGVWFGERLAALHRDRARRRADADDALREDMRRWKAVSRQLAAQRAALLGSRQQPFRSEPRVLAS
ncbi:MAG: hypothetical protein AAGF11_11265 [Myxococcota bacterium]